MQGSFSISNNKKSQLVYRLFRKGHDRYHISPSRFCCAHLSACFMSEAMRDTRKL